MLILYFSWWCSNSIADITVSNAYVPCSMLHAPCYIANDWICHLDANHWIRHVQLVNADDTISNAGATVSNADATVSNADATVSNDDVHFQMMILWFLMMMYRFKWWF
jgi:hypothetical protein